MTVRPGTHYRRLQVLLSDLLESLNCFARAALLGPPGDRYVVVHHVHLYLKALHEICGEAPASLHLGALSKGVLRPPGLRNACFSGAF